jgi:hypothetical protein
MLLSNGFLCISYPSIVSVNLSVDNLMEFYFIDVNVSIQFIYIMHTPISILSMIIMLKDNHSGTENQEILHLWF